jgi:hypothetical protein
VATQNTSQSKTIKPANTVIPWPYAILLILAGLLISYWLLNGIPVFLGILLLLAGILVTLIMLVIRVGRSNTSSHTPGNPG